MGDGAGEPVIHLFKLFSYYGEIRETDVISMWFNHTGWWINGAWLFQVIFFYFLLALCWKHMKLAALNFVSHVRVSHSRWS